MPSPRHAPVQFSAPDFFSLEIERSKYKNAGLSNNTVLSYARDWRVFTAWCAAADRVALPAGIDTVELYASDMLSRGRKVTTLERHASAIQHQHRTEGQESPCGPSLRALLSGARRILCQRPLQKDAITVDELRAMVRKVGHHSPIAARDSAILLFGYASALRRSTLAALQLDHVEWRRRGILVWIGKEKQNREGVGRELGIPFGKHKGTCPVGALRRWLAYRGKQPGPMFCHVIRGCPILKALDGNRIGQIVQERAAAIGLDRKRIGAHSLRAGMATTALEKGAGEIRVAAHTGHASLGSLGIYFRKRDPWTANVVYSLGL